MMPTSPYTDEDGQYRPLFITEVGLKHPAYLAARKSWTSVNQGDKEGWMAMWADDGFIADPVGPSFLDPEGAGHHGWQARSEFWDKAIALPEHIEFRFDRAVACGDELMCIGTIRNHLGDTYMDAEGAVIYRVNSDGAMLSLRAFWEVEHAMTTIRPSEKDPSS